MRLLHLPTLISLSVLHLAAFAQDTTFLNSSGNICERDKYAYMRVAEKRNNVWEVAVYYCKGGVEMTGRFLDDWLTVRTGDFRDYGSNGEVRHLCRYVNGKKEGMERYFGANGKLQEEGANKSNERDGEWTGYYPSGKIAGKASFTAGKQTSVHLFNEDGSGRADTVFHRESRFPGGIIPYREFLARNLHFPKAAYKRMVDGTVVVQFTISTTGKVVEPEVVVPVEEHLDAEALRVIKKMPDWEPEVVGGVAVESYKKQPVVFKLPY